MIRPKHIFIPLAVIAVLFSYNNYAASKASLFDHELWADKKDNYRVENAGSVMAWNMTTGMTRGQVFDLLSLPDRGHSTVCELGGSQPNVWRVDTYVLEGLKVVNIEYDQNDRVIDFYINDEPRRLLF